MLGVRGANTGQLAGHSLHSWATSGSVIRCPSHWPITDEVIWTAHLAPVQLPAQGAQPRGKEKGRKDGLDPGRAGSLLPSQV